MDNAEKLAATVTLSVLIDELDKKNYIKKTELKKEVIEEVETYSNELSEGSIRKAKIIIDNMIK
ncbi:MAG: hypothetical protein LIR50_13985 [Bacillota bacterium]|nr:hypothetical protein [Bacillota bacterium]